MIEIVRGWPSLSLSGHEGEQRRAPAERSTAAMKLSEDTECPVGESIVCGPSGAETPAPSKVSRFGALAGKKLQLELRRVESREWHRIRTRLSG
ncbi:uncharacterized protein CCOS01_03511 [Colletotrichum costaricense]|uniref:Uncharacterized protein n=1 Tax=Colletotrichum costaricense TaxID=1209916 RepID=A0AAJ0E5T7_9PEZI|nr:uncharacterized protein CCOS01_03511 [Colletotrichum costaricense]KAK1534759.1 hypothetical protein CCOS01_03511 [Colletotrichum costaricense]